MSSTAGDFLSLILPCGREDFGRHNELRPDLFEKILVLASDAVLAPVGQEVPGDGHHPVRIGSNRNSDGS